MLSSVRRCAQPIVSALKARGIPYVVSGMTGLFDTLEVQASVGIFRFMIQEIEPTDLRQLWHQAGLGLTGEDLNRGIVLLSATRTFEPGKRFSVYNLQRTYLVFLETVGLREERIPADRGEVVYYNLGKLSRVITDYEAIRNADRYDTGIEDERRLFYVAMTRSEKYLFCSWAPDPDNQLYRKPSLFWEELTRKEQFLTRDPGPAEGKRLQPEPRRPLVNVDLSFSDLKYFFECPYQFKLRFLYGFNPLLHEALGYEQRFGRKPDLIEVHNLDHGGSVRELVDQQMSTETLAAVKDAGQKLRANELGRLVQWCQNCAGCDLCGICRVRSANKL